MSSEKLPDTAKISNTLTRARPRRKIDAACIAQMAKAVARKLTESEAARLCELEPRHWFEFKSRGKNKEKFAALLEAYQAARYDALISRVEASAEGKGGVKYPDWRAAAHLLSISDKRFQDRPAVGVSVNTPTYRPPYDWDVVFKLALTMPPPDSPYAKGAIDVQATPLKQLPAPAAPESAPARPPARLPTVRQQRAARPRIGAPAGPVDDDKTPASGDMPAGEPVN